LERILRKIASCTRKVLWWIAEMVMFSDLDIEKSTPRSQYKMIQLSVLC
jgi:hypothetical protein